MPPKVKVMPRLALVVAGGLSIALTVCFTVWLDRRDNLQYVIILISLLEVP